MKKCSTFLAIKEMWVKTELRFHFTSFKMAIIKQIKTRNSGEEGGGEELL
jgi:hypothetical protein